MKIGPYDVYNSNSNGKSRNCVRVKLEGVILAEVFPDHSNPLKHIRQYPLTEVRAEFVRQLKANFVSDDDVKMLLKLPAKE